MAHIEHRSNEINMIPINKPMIGEEERREVLEVLDENSTLTSPAKDGGKKVQNFEQLLREFLHVKHAIAGELRHGGFVFFLRRSWDKAR